MTKRGNTAISVGYEKILYKRVISFRLVECDFHTGVFWFESPTATGLVCRFVCSPHSSRRTHILVLTSIGSPSHYLLFAFKEHVTLTMSERI